MNISKLKEYFTNMSTSQLKEILGTPLCETLLEWNPSRGEAIFTKTRLVEMIFTVFGVHILKDRQVRKYLLSSMTENEVLSFLPLLPHSMASCAELTAIVERVAATPWKRNRISLHLLELLELPDSLFEVQSKAASICGIVNTDADFYELLDYQYVIRQKALTILSSPKELSRMLIHMPTGTGKTKTAVHIISNYYSFQLQHKGLVIWIAHTTELLQQAYDTFQSVWKHIGRESVNCYRIWGANDITGITNFNGFMFCSIKKLMSISESNPGWLDLVIHHARIIVYDEAHKAAAPESRKIVERFMVKKKDMGDRSLIGLTATPGRSTLQSFDNELLTSMFENRIISIDTRLMNAINLSPQEALNSPVEDNIILFFQNRRVLARIQKEELTYPETLSDEEMQHIRVAMTNNGYEDFTQAALEIIGRNKQRNLQIMKKIRQLNQEKKPTILFACSVKHGQLLSAMMSLENIPNALVIGDMLPEERADAINAFKDRQNPVNVIINYEVLTTGFDSTNIRCVFITRPTHSIVLYSQMLGRGLRGPLMGGNEQCLLIDIRDNLRQFDVNMAFSHFDSYWKG